MNRPHTTSGDPGLARQLVSQLAELETLLEGEYDAIRQRDIARIEAITHDKQTLLDHINATAESMGNTLEDLISGSASPGASSDKIRALLTRCRQANKTNAAAIETCQSFTTSLLDVLQGRIPGERTYTARGRLRTGTGSSAFVRV